MEARPPNEPSQFWWQSAPPALGAGAGAEAAAVAAADSPTPPGRDLHSSTFRLNVTRFLWDTLASVCQ